MRKAYVGGLGQVSVALALVGCGDDGGGDSSAGDASTSTTMSATSDTSSTTDPSGTATSTTDTSSGPTSESTGTSESSDSSSSESTGGVCPEDEIVCEGNQAKTCDGMGGFKDMTDCTDVCVEGIGCTLCVPGEGQCQGDISMVCNDEGDGFEEEECDAVQGVSCNQGTGKCEGTCSADSLGLTYIGCDYYPTVTQQNDFFNTAPQHEYAVAVANTAGVVANVTVTQGGNNVTAFTVDPDTVVVQVLPWVDALTKGTGPSVMVPDGAYRLRSDQPVTVYQYNPLASTVSNDASILIPVNAWGQRAVVASYPYWNPFNWPGFHAIVASQDATTVTLTPPPNGSNVQAGGGVAADGSGQVMLDRGDVLQVITGSNGDSTGAFVDADQPVQVIAGHACTNVPVNVTACDHLEETMFPIETLAKEYLVVPPVQVPNDMLDKAQVIRILATEDDTMLTFEPDQGVNDMLANAGDYVEINTTTAAFRVSSAKKIMVAQYMVGQSGGFGTSDPAMLITVPAEQFRDDYLFHAATGWTANYVDIVAMDGAVVTVDAGNVNAWTPIGATGFSVAHVQLSNAGDGTHRVSADGPVGISVYGVQGFGSYWYPGGLDLNLIPQ